MLMQKYAYAKKMMPKPIPIHEVIKFRTGYLSWNNYKSRIDALSEFYFQQDARKASIRNLLG